MDTLDPLWRAIKDLIFDHWIKFLFTAGIFLLTTGFGIFTAWRALRNRTFYRRFHFSLNLIENGKLLIRTLDEQDAAQVLLDNSAAINGVIKAAKRTTEENPFLDLDPDLRWLTLNSALNELARIVPCQGLFHRDWGYPVESHTYILGLTCEKDKDVRTRKVRLMIIREKVLRQISTSTIETPAVEQESHTVRWRTLRKMAELYTKEPKRFMKFEISLPQPVSAGTTATPAKPDPQTTKVATPPAPAAKLEPAREIVPF